MLDAGADLRGKTHMDELAYALNGENFHYGTPVNPACPDRIPGGSSSGSAVCSLLNNARCMHENKEESTAFVLMTVASMMQAIVAPATHVHKQLRII